MEATLSDKLAFYELQAKKIRERISHEIEALIEDLQHTQQKMKRYDYTPPGDGLIKGYAQRIDSDCAKLDTMREMLRTIHAGAANA